MEKWVTNAPPDEGLVVVGQTGGFYQRTRAWVMDNWMLVLGVLLLVVLLIVFFATAGFGMWAEGESMYMDPACALPPGVVKQMRDEVAMRVSGKPGFTQGTPVEAFDINNPQVERESFLVQNYESDLRLPDIEGFAAEGFTVEEEARRTASRGGLVGFLAS